MTGLSFLTGHNPLNGDPLALFFVQLLVILAVSRLLSLPFKYLRQPIVIAEVIGGILLGKSALGRIPGFSELLFPSASLETLKLVADIGLTLFLFLVGMELDISKLRSNWNKSAAISIAGILVPFSAGVGVSKYIYDNMMTNKNVSFTSFMVFCGVAMSITAFPVLARILTDRKLLQTHVGQVTLASAATDDAIAWCLLVLVVALINNPSNAVFAVYVFLAVVAWFVFLWVVVRPALHRLVVETSSQDRISQSAVFATFVCVIVSAWFTQTVGVDAIFGGFLMGVVTPDHDNFHIKMTEKVEDLVSIFFLPLYFAYAGINVNISSLTGFGWGMVALSIFVACAGKIIGCTLAAKGVGLAWRESLTVGVLMNTKGLVELIVLTLGLQAGVITQDIYTIFVLMAVVTTFMTVPIVSTLYPMSMYAHEHDERTGSTTATTYGEKGKSGVEQELRSSTATISNLPPHLVLLKPSAFSALMGEAEGTKVLVVLPSMRTVPAMMNLTQIFGKHTSKLTVFALRLIELSGRMSKVMMAAQQSSQTLRSDPVINVFRTFSQLSHVIVRTLLAVCGMDDFAETILDACDSSNSDLILYPVEVDRSMTTHQHHEGSSKDHPFFVKDVVSKQLFKKAKRCSIAVFYDRGFGVSSSPDEPAWVKGCRTQSSSSSSTSGASSNHSPGFLRPLFRSKSSASDMENPNGGAGEIERLQATIQQSEAIHTRVLLPFFGSDDDCEAAMMALLLAKHYEGRVTVVDFSKKHMVTTTTAGGGDSSMMTRAESLLALVRESSTNQQITILPAESLILPCDSSLTVPTRGNSGRSGNTPLDQLKRMTTDFMGNDIIVIGRSQYEEDALIPPMVVVRDDTVSLSKTVSAQSSNVGMSRVGSSSSGTGVSQQQQQYYRQQLLVKPFKAWLETETRSSFIVIQKKKKEEKEEE